MNINTPADTKSVNGPVTAGSNANISSSTGKIIDTSSVNALRTTMSAAATTAPLRGRSPSPDGTQDYDVTRMREEDFERLAVYIVPDVQCERGVANRADKTLPRSLTLKPSLVFSSANVKVSGEVQKLKKYHKSLCLRII